MADTKFEASKVITDNMGVYSTYVLLDRAIPDLRDGWKPVHRRILFTLFTAKAFKFTKSANISGQVMKIHPHSDTYDTMVKMVQKDRHAIPTIIGKGSFGQNTSRDLAPAAARYSEVKLSDVGTEMMQNFNKNMVDFIDNYDGTMKIPEVLPVKFPSVLAYASSGTGVGFASSIPSFNLKEITQAIENYMKTGEKNILIPDFATKGFVVNDPAVFEQINHLGNGSTQLRGRAIIDKNKIDIMEIPYSTTREAIIEKVTALAKTEKLKEVTNIKDLTGFKGMRISITARKGTDMNLLLEKLYQFTPLQSSFPANMNMIVDGLPKVMGVWPAIIKWLEWRANCISRGISFDINKIKEDLHLLYGFEKVIDHIDEVIEIIRFSKEKDIIPKLVRQFNIDEIQADKVADMKLRNINKEYIEKQIKNIRDMENRAISMQSVLDDPKKMNTVILQGLKSTSEKYGVDRQSKVIEISQSKQLKIKNKITEKAKIENDYNVVVHLTAEGYAYKFRKTDLEPTLKPGDEIAKTFNTQNSGSILIFNEEQDAFKVDVSAIEETKPKALGSYLPTLAKEDSIDIVEYGIVDNSHTVIMAIYDNNKVARLSKKHFDLNRRVLKKALNTKQKIHAVLFLEKESTLKLVTDKATVEFNTSSYSENAVRTATGVYATRKGKLKYVVVV